MNYRGVRLSATFQNWTTFGTLALFVVFVLAGVTRGSPTNFPPLFTHTPLVSILLVLQIVPYYMTGYESVTKAAEEANPQFRAEGILSRYIRRNHRRCFLLHDRDCGGRLCRSLAFVDWRLRS